MRSEPLWCSGVYPASIAFGTDRVQWFRSRAPVCLIGHILIRMEVASPHTAWLVERSLVHQTS